MLGFDFMITSNLSMSSHGKILDLAKFACLKLSKYQDLTIPTCSSQGKFKDLTLTPYVHLKVNIKT
jgi:hypothetical protein